MMRGRIVRLIALVVTAAALSVSAPVDAKPGPRVWTEKHCKNWGTGERECFRVAFVNKPNTGMTVRHIDIWDPHGCGYRDKPAYTGVYFKVNNRGAHRNNSNCGHSYRLTARAGNIGGNTGYLYFKVGEIHKRAYNGHNVSVRFTLNRHS